MDFSLNDDHLALRDAVRRFCDAEYPAHERGNAESSAQAAQRHGGFAELGLLGLCLDPELGGSGLGAVETLLVAQELGRAFVPGAWLPNAVLAGPLLAALGTPAQCQAWLPALAAGTLQAALACHEAQARYSLCDVQTTARREGSQWRVDGRKTLVLGGDSAALLLVVARTHGERRDPGGLTLFAVDSAAPGVAVQPFALLDQRRAAHVTLDAVRVGADRVIGPVDGALPQLERAIDRAEAALCAESAGALEALLETTAEHLRTRRQFGVPLAKFQALQHRVADLQIALEQLRSMACAAALALEAPGDDERRRLVSAAKTLVAQLGRRCAFDVIQLHGAMGMTDECRVGHGAKRLIANGQLFGDAALHLQRFMNTSTGDRR
jgi:pimeloyl-CoA dehydrogenase